MTTTSTPSTTTSTTEDVEMDPIIQYLVIRKDLRKWSTGSLMAQVSHASVAAVALTLEDEATKAYLQDLDRMRTCVLQISSGEELLELSDQLLANGVVHKVWIETPGDIPTCLATKPAAKSLTGPFLSHLKLMR